MTTEQIIKEFRKKFVFEEDNRPLVKLMFRVNPDGSRSLVLPEDIEAFLISTLEDVAKELEGIKGKRLDIRPNLDEVQGYNVAVDSCNEKLDQLITSLRDKGVME